MTTRLIAPQLTRSLAQNVFDAKPVAPDDDPAWHAFMAQLRATGALGDEGHGVLCAPEDPFVAQMQAFLAATACDNGSPEGAEIEERDVTFDDKDWGGWALSFFQWWRSLRPAPFRPRLAPVIDPIPETGELALFGDWGSGRYGAPVISRTLETMATAPHAAIHLGDTYYAGTPEELRDNVLGIWPKREGMRGYLLNGNHERYGGDIGYFAALDEIKQPFSYFAVGNQHFTVIALDSAYDNVSLAGNQLDWTRKILEHSAGKKIILLTHHQPYSAFEGDGGGMVELLRPLLEARQIHAWYWGHEHRCVIYHRHPTWKLLGRCIGHGGYPYFLVQPEDGWKTVAGDNGSRWYEFGPRRDAPGGRILGDDNPYVISPKKIAYGAHGFVTLGFDGPRCIESYRRPDGELVYQAELAL